MMSVDGMLEELGLIEWDGPFDAATRGRAVTALEEGRVLFLPRLAFRLDAAEQRFLTPDVAGGDRKNVSFDPISGKLGGSALAGEDAAALGAMIDRFGRQEATLLEFRKQSLLHKRTSVTWPPAQVTLMVLSVAPGNSAPQ